MKRYFRYAVLLAGVMLLDSCGLANGLAQTAGRLVQGVGRTVGIGR